MTVVPRNKERVKLLGTLPQGWGERMTDPEIATVIAGELEDAERILKKYGLMWGKNQKTQIEDKENDE